MSIRLQFFIILKVEYSFHFIYNKIIGKNDIRKYDKTGVPKAAFVESKITRHQFEPDQQLSR